MLLIMWLLTAPAACSGGGPADAGRDGAVDGGDSAAENVIAPPEIPWLSEGVPPIMLAPCPEGWREVHGGDVVECDPYPEGGAASCDAGEAHFPGEPGCRAIGDACPSGDYATSLPTSGPVVYVNAGASGGGDGTLGAPFAGLGDVPWASLTAGTTVALGKGTYLGAVPLKAGVGVVGACVRETTLTGLAAPVPSVVSVTSAGEAAVVQGLTIRDAPQNGVLVRGGRRLSLQGVLIERTTGTGVMANGGGAEVSLSDVVIRDTAASATATLEPGLGIAVWEGARATATRLVVAGNGGVGISARDEGASVVLTDVVIRDTRPDPADLRQGRGINVQWGARVEATRVLAAGNHDVGIFASRGGSVTLTDAVVRDTVFRASDGTGGRGIVVQSGAEVATTRVLVANNRDLGVFVEDPGSIADLTDVVIRDSGPFLEGQTTGRGLNVQVGGRCAATRLLISGSAGLGVHLADAGSTLSVTDAVIRFTAESQGPDYSGRGVSAQFGVRFDASRLLIHDTHGIGIIAMSEGTVVTLSDVVIRDTHPGAEELDFGHGIQAQSAVQLEGRRLEIRRSFEVGIGAFTGARVELSDTTIHGVEKSACASTSCPDRHRGYGAGAYAAALSMTRFQVTGVALCGVMVAAFGDHPNGPVLDLRAGVVSDSEIGACVQVDGYDLGRLTTDVRYVHNVTNLSSTMLPVPDVGAPL